MLPALTGATLPAESVPESGRPRWTSSQLAVAAFVGLVVLTAIATAAYFFGRMSSVPSASAQSRPDERFIIVDPVTRQPAQPAAPAKQSAIPPPPRAARPAPAASVGDNYFQVAALDQGMAAVSVEYLKQKGFAATTTPGPTPQVFRVMVGPLHDSALPETKLALENLGFRPFLKRQ